jgi:hypothetical protein
LTRENADQVGPIARFAEEHGIGVEYFPAALYEGYNEDIVLDSNERDEVFREAMELKRQGLPVYNTMYALELMRSGRPFKCNLARLAVQVAPDGTMYPCEPRVIADPEPYGHISEVDLKDLPSLPVYARNVERLASCNACLLPCVANMSDSLFMQGVRELQLSWVRSIKGNDYCMHYYAYCPGSAGIGVPPLLLSECGGRAHAFVSALRAACLPRRLRRRQGVF